MEEVKKNEIIDLREVVRSILKRKKLFLKVWCITFVLSCAWILPIPRSYVADVILAPEAGGASTDGMLGSLASQFGFNMSVNSGDALYPLLYPDLMASNDFLVDLFDIQVSTIDGELKTDYYTYLTKHQKKAFYRWPIIWTKGLIQKLLPKKEKRTAAGKGGKVDPFYLSEKQYQLIEGMKKLITCSVDKKTDVITIQVVDQDPLICACIADSVRVRLQKFITDYRTSKVRVDQEYYERLVKESYDAYQKSMNAYARYCDRHRDAILQTMLSERDALENDMQMKFNTYNVMNTQLEAAKAKVQEKTPAFTILKGASVPVKPSKPKRMIFVAAMLFLTTMGTIFYIIAKDTLQLIPSLPK